MQRRKFITKVTINCESKYIYCYTVDSEICKGFGYCTISKLATEFLFSDCQKPLGSSFNSVLKTDSNVVKTAFVVLCKLLK